MWKKVLLLLGAVMLCHALQAQELVDTIEYFDPNEVFEVSEDTVELARIEACRMVAGEWHYKKPYVHADGSSFIGKLGKPIAKSKLKKNLGKAYKKLKIKKKFGGKNNF